MKSIRCIRKLSLLLPSVTVLALSACSDFNNRSTENQKPVAQEKSTTSVKTPDTTATVSTATPKPFSQALASVERGASGWVPKEELSEAGVEQKPVQPEVKEVIPPKGAEPYQNELEKFVDVKVSPERLKRAQPKTPSKLSKAPQKPDTELSLGFSSLSFSPKPGIDERLLEAISQPSNREYTYGFIYLDEYLSPETEEKLTSIGLKVLDVHGDMYTVKIPRNEKVLRQAIELDYVQWIGYSLPEQKISEGLGLIQEKYAGKVDRVPVFINLFDPEFGKQGLELLQNADITLGRFDKSLGAYHAAISPKTLKWLIEQDYVLFVEFDEPGSRHHDESMAVMGVDYIRTGGAGTNFNGSTTIMGILDTGFMLGNAAATTHVDMSKNGCGRNYTTDAAGVWDDEDGHGTHVLGTIIGSGTGNSRNRGVADGVGNSTERRIRAAKVLDSNGNFPGASWVTNGMDFMAGANNCDSPRPHIVNASLGTFAVGGSGTGTLARKLDANTWDHRQLYVISAGNSGTGASTITSPADAKTALSVGNVWVEGYLTIGDINTTTVPSSRGPTGDGRMKPNLVATGSAIWSVNAGTNQGYTSKTGTSMAAPHVAGIAATVRQHYSIFENRPHLMRAHLMASSILHDDNDTPANNSNGGRNTYGLGRVSTYISHWARSGSGGWSGHWASRNITNSNWGYRDIDVPSGTDRLVVVMTWDEDSASSGASKAVKYDLDLWIDRNADCTPDSKGQCGEWASQSYDDNVEYLIINDPPAGVYRLKIINWDAPSSGLPAAIAATVIKGDPTPGMSVSTSASTTTPAVNTNFTINTRVGADAYIASGTNIEISSMSPGLQVINIATTREDGIAMNFSGNEFSMGNIVSGDTRSATWTLRASSPGNKRITFRVWSENGGTHTRTINLTVN